MFKWKRRQETLAGLDIGSSSVKTVELISKGGQPKLIHLAHETLKADAIQDGQIIDLAEVSNAIASVFSDQRSKAQQMAVGVNGISAIVKNLALPPMSNEELAESIDWHAEEYIPYDLADLLFDYQVIESLPGQLWVLLAACKRETVANLKQSIDGAGKQTSIVDFDLLALANCYIYNYEPSEDSHVALVDLGASSLTLNIMRGRRSEFMRTATVGGNHFTHLLQEKLGLTRDQAEAAKRSGTREIEINSAQIGGVVAELSKMLSFKAVTDTFSERVALEIQRTFDFYRSTSDNDVRVEKLILSGGSSRIEGLADFFARKFEIPVEPFNPFRRIQYKEEDFSAEQLKDVAPEMAVAVGLALRGVEKAAAVTINLLDAEEKRVVLAAKLPDGMATYRFRATNRVGDLVKGERVAASRASLKRMLQQEGLTLLSVSEQFKRLFPFAPRFSRERVSPRELAQFTRSFSFLIDCGATVIGSLEASADEAKQQYFKQVVSAVVNSLEEGERFSEAIARHPTIFDRRYIDMVDAGESGGILDIVLQRLVTLMEKQSQRTRKVKLALLYPLTTLALLLLAFITLALRPSGIGRPEHLFTRFFLGIGAFLFGIGGAIGLSIILITTVAFFFVYKSERGRRWIDTRLLRAPLVVGLLRNRAMAEFAGLLSTLLYTGNPILQSLNLTAEGARNIVFKDAIHEIRKGVERGESFLAAMTNDDAFRRLDRIAIGLGENTGALDALLARMAQFYEYEYDTTIAELPIRFVPFLILLYVFLVGFAFYYR